jgi:transcriptional antiterminator RfaH
MSADTLNTLKWFVVMTKPGKQDEVVKRLSGAGFEVFDPKLKQYSHKRTQYVIRVLFPLYTFVKLDIQKDHRLINYTRGVLRILGVGGVPHPVSDTIVEKISNSCDENGVINAKYTEEDIKEGDKVRITSGPLQGIEAVVSGLYNDQQRIEILMDLLKVSLPEKHVKKV